jgi:hypothetical protein
MCITSLNCFPFVFRCSFDASQEFSFSTCHFFYTKDFLILRLFQLRVICYRYVSQDANNLCFAQNCWFSSFQKSFVIFYWPFMLSFLSSFIKRCCTNLAHLYTNTLLNNIKENLLAIRENLSLYPSTGER